MARGFAVVGLINPKTEANVGGALRAAACYDAAMVIVQGQRYKQQSTDTTKAWKHIPMVQVKDLCDVIPYDCVPVAIEITDGAKCLTKFSHPERAIYIFGQEDGSVPKDLLAKCKHVIQIPTKYCMNLAATVNVVLYDRIAKRSNLAAEVQQ